LLEWHDLPSNERFKKLPRHPFRTFSYLAVKKRVLLHAQALLAVDNELPAKKIGMKKSFDEKIGMDVFNEKL
jgi:hypothetical protein